MSPRAAATVAFLVLGAALVAVVAFGTPWRPAPEPPGGAGRPEVAADFTPAQVARESAFHGALRPWSLTALALGTGFALVLGCTPLGARLIELVARPFGGGWVWRALLGGLVLGMLGQLLTLPMAMRSEVVLRRYGISTQTWGGWFADVAKSWAVGAVVAAVVLVGFYAVVRATPNWWWAWAAGAGAALVLLFSFAFPVLIAPLFNTFTPMPDSPLRTELIQLADDSGEPVKDVLVADASKRTTALNAYVSGYGASRRLVLYDTLLREAPDQEVKLVVAHELGHAATHDVLTGTVIGALGAAAGACGLFLLFSLTPLLRWAGVEQLGDPRSLGAVLAVVAVVGLLGTPAQNLISRRIEARADEHALTITDDPAGFVAMQRRLAVTNLSELDPNAVVYAWFFSHPSGPERIAAARDHARHTGRPIPAATR